MADLENGTNVRSFLIRAAGRWAPGATARAASLLFFTAPPRHHGGRGERALLSTATPLEVVVGPHRVRAWSWGSGRPVLLSHGWGGRAGQMRSLVRALRARGLRPVALDLPGHGRSSGHSTDIGSSAAAIRAVGEQVGPLHGIVAHSLGAPSAVLALRRGLRAERLVLVGPAADPYRYAEAWARRIGPAAGRRFLDLVQRRIGASPEEVAVGSGPVPGVELLVVHDADDREVPLHEAEQAAEAWPGARMLRTGGLGHRRVLHDAGVLHEVTAFLGRGLPPAADALGQELFHREWRWRAA